MTLRCISWKDPAGASHSIIKHAPWVNGFSADFVALADNVIADFATNNHHDGIIMVRGFPETGVGEIIDTANLGTLVKDGPFPANVIADFTTFLNRIVSQGSDIHTILMDQEGSIDHDNDTVKMGQIYDDPVAKARTAQDMQSYTGALFATDGPQTPTGHSNRWNDWIDGVFIAHAWRIAIKDTAESILGHPVEVVNYKDMNLSFEVVWRNGWHRSHHGGVSNLSNPVCYMTDGGTRWSTASHTKWGAFIDANNIMRSCIRAGVGPVWPWVRANVNNVDTTVVHQLGLEFMVHADRAGCGTILYFNTDENAAQDQAIENHLAMINAMGPPTGPINLEEIPLTATEVTTGGYTTTYADMSQYPPIAA